MNSIGRFYKKIVNFSIVTRYFVYVLPVGLALAAPVIIFGYNDEQRGHYIASLSTRTYLFFLWLEIVWLSLWVSKLFSKIIPSLFMALIGVVSSGTRKYALVLKAVEIELSLVGWAVTSLVTSLLSRATQSMVEVQDQLKGSTVTQNGVRVVSNL